MQGYKGVPCGGTHVKNVAEIGLMTIRKVNHRKGNTKISYAIQPNPPVNWEE